MQPQRKPRQRLQQRLAIANDFNGMPPRKPRLAVGSPRRKETLTQKFNRASKSPLLSRHEKHELIKKQINALRRQMSQPKATLEFGLMGSVNNARNPKRDRNLVKQIKGLESQMKQMGHRRLKTHNQKRGLAGNKGLAKKQFNRANGMGL